MRAVHVCRAGLAGLISVSARRVAVDVEGVGVAVVACRGPVTNKCILGLCIRIRGIGPNYRLHLMFLVKMLSSKNRIAMLTHHV